MTNITAIIHTKNAEEHLQEVIDHLKMFDCIMIVDMESDDRTLEIAQVNGCRILPVEDKGYGCPEPVRDYAIKSAETEWVFFVDADEIIPAELSKKLIEIAASPGDVRGVRIARKNMLLDGWNKSTYPDYQLRFLHKDSSQWPPHVHSFPSVDGRVISLPKLDESLAMIHKAPSISAVMERMNRYTTAEVERRKGESVSIWKMLFKPWFRFFRSYILKGGILRGMSGYFSAKNDANYKFYIYSKLYEEKIKGKE
ncbi:MAG: glycosyltransferase family 2 protein [Muribaculaceae bacterium]|nr:glycosyltransferase family 2 protein [Muribaculaceae bacterium]